MEGHRDLLLALIDYLIQHGYPDESLVPEWQIGERARVDLAVIDPETNKALALFELKRSKTADSTRMALKQLEVFSSTLGNEQVPLYIVFGIEETRSLEVYLYKRGKYTENNLELVKEVPGFVIFQKRKIRQAIEQTEEERKEAIDYFQSACWIIAVLILILFVLDILHILNMTKERLVLIGVIIGLVIVPFASKLKILGLEFERLKEKGSK